MCAAATTSPIVVAAQVFSAQVSTIAATIRRR